MKTNEKYKLPMRFVFLKLLYIKTVDLLKSFV